MESSKRGSRTNPKDVDVDVDEYVDIDVGRPDLGNLKSMFLGREVIDDMGGMGWNDGRNCDCNSDRRLVVLHSHLRYVSNLGTAVESEHDEL